MAIVGTDEDADTDALQGMTSGSDVGNPDKDDIDFNASIDVVRVPPRPMAILPDNWKGKALAFKDEPGAPAAAPEAMTGESTDPHNPPDPYDGWTEDQWKQTDDDKPDDTPMGPGRKTKSWW